MKKNKTKKKKRSRMIIISEKPAYLVVGNHYIDLETLVDILKEHGNAGIINQEVLSDFSEEDISRISKQMDKVKYVKSSMKLYYDLIKVFKEHVTTNTDKA